MQAPAHFPDERGPMPSLYRVLAMLVAIGVVVQAAAIAFAVFGLLTWVKNGGILDASVLQSADVSVGGSAGFAIHGMNGQLVLPVISLLLLLASFFAKIPGGIRWAIIVLAATLLQVALGEASHAVAGLGWLHGVLAVVLFGLAVSAAMRVRRAVAAEAPA